MLNVSLSLVKFIKLVNEIWAGVVSMTITNRTLSPSASTISFPAGTIGKFLKELWAIVSLIKVGIEYLK